MQPDSKKQLLDIHPQNEIVFKGKCVFFVFLQLSVSLSPTLILTNNRTIQQCGDKVSDAEESDREDYCFQSENHGSETILR